MKIIPDTRPRLSLDELKKLCPALEAEQGKVAVVVIPGYYAKSMGPTSGNDRGVYDDAAFVVSPSGMVAYNFNTDPSIFRSRTSAKQGIATLKPGIHPFKKGNHGISRPGGGYPAFRPATKGERLPVFRDGDSDQNAFGVAINIHKGGYNGTSSEGCQTLHPAQWDSFYSLVTGEMKRCGQTTFNLIKLAA